MIVRAVMAAVAALLLASCSLPVVNQEADALARGFYESVRTGADLTNDPRLAPELRTPNINAQLASARAMIPNTPPTSVDNSSFHINTDANGTRVDLQHSYHYADRVVQAETVMTKAPGAATFLIAGFHTRITSGATTPTTQAAPAPTGAPMDTGQPAMAPADSGQPASDGPPK